MNKMAKLRVANGIVFQNSPPLSRCLCTESIPETPVSRSFREKTLFQKLSPLAHPNVTETEVAQVFTEWNKTCKPPMHFEIINCVKRFRTRQDFCLALKLIRWMETSDMGVKNSDRAIEIDLLYKTEGIESAEKYFDELHQSEKTDKTYGVLFSCYCREKELEKAFELFERMKELGFATTLSYNSLISIYIKKGQPRMVASLVEEMEQTSVSLNIFTYNMLIDSYAAIKDFDAIKNVLKMMETKNIKVDWVTYGKLANLYIDSGLLGKASTIVEDMENRIPSHRHNEVAFQIMIDIFARLNKLSSIYATWENLKLIYPTPSNKSYLIMLLALFKMGETESLEKYFKEWEASCSSYDVRLSNVLLESYLNRDMIEEANMLNERVHKRSKEPNLKACKVLSNFHIKRGEINLALKYLDMGAKIAVAKKHKWYPTNETIKSFLEYFEKGNDTENTKIFIECMKRFDHIDSAVYESLGNVLVNPRLPMDECQILMGEPRISGQ